MKYNQNTVLTSTITYLISFLIFLFIKFMIDKIFGNNPFSGWLLTASIPFYGVIKILTNHVIFDWSNTFLNFITTTKSWSFNSIIKLCFQLVELFKIIALIPVHAFIMIVSAGIVYPTLYQLA